MKILHCLINSLMQKNINKPLPLRFRISEFFTNEGVGIYF